MKFSSYFTTLVKCAQLLEVLATAKGNDEATKDCLNGLDSIVTERMSSCANSIIIFIDCLF